VPSCFLDFFTGTWGSGLNFFSTLYGVHGVHEICTVSTW
jgi:hypothetical protein